ncbi:sigma-70 factor domain-containing protein, partial [Streptomyces sp. NPDC020125]|uniref:sigma-70 factor domain-containing protein n=1 Tax=Streptomyces sp. NPDC020125 TaxID=3154593 RepID=UPI00340F9766
PLLSAVEEVELARRVEAGPGFVGADGTSAVSLPREPPMMGSVRCPGPTATGTAPVGVPGRGPRSGPRSAVVTF